jgi:hypothetical protein
MGNRAYRRLGSFDGGHNVIRQVDVLVWVIYLLCKFHKRLSRKQGVNYHVFYGFSCIIIPLLVIVI